MNERRLIYGNITFYKRYYRLVAAAVLITVAVIVGSLVTGDSVRKTLVNRVHERLGSTETVLFARDSYLSDKLLNTPTFSHSEGFLLLNGFISREGKLIPVSVWGCGDMRISRGEAKVNPALAREMDATDGSPVPAIALRLPSAGVIPSGSPFVTGNYTTALRLSFAGVAGAAEGGNISLKNDQMYPLNIFVNRGELAEALGVDGKINLILDDSIISDSLLAQAWDYSLSGLAVRDRGEFTEITSDRIFLRGEVVESIRSHNGANRLYSYLANTIRSDWDTIPYSFVTAADSYRGRTLGLGEVILSDYSAKRLQVGTGDTVGFSYYTFGELKTWQTKSVTLRVADIVPLTELAGDSTLSADFPGLSDAGRCSDWDSDLPLDMSLIGEEDEAFWELFGNTPKAILPYGAVADDWSNAYGCATALRIPDGVPRLQHLRAEMFGLQLSYPREAALYAARNGVDFSSLFMALGFFIIVSAMLLMLIPLREMLYRRQGEFGVLRTLGYPPKRIVRILWRESAPVVLMASAAGAVAGMAYTALIIRLLGNVWKGATHTDGFRLYPGAATIAAGLAAGVVLSLSLLRIGILRNLHGGEEGRLKPLRQSLRGRGRNVVLLSVASIGAIAANLLILQSAALFMLTGVLLLTAFAAWGDFLVCRRPAGRGGQGLSDGKLVLNTLAANRKQSLLSFYALAIGVFTVFSVGLNRRGFSDSSRLTEGTGGYSLWIECSVPLYHSLMTDEGRAKLGLTELPEDVEVLQCLRFGADDASCLNLNRVSSPGVLGVDMAALSASGFVVSQSVDGRGFAGMRGRDGAVYPALIDATVLTWSLGRKLGDTLRYKGDGGREVALRLTGTLPNTLFQGSVLIDRSHFGEIWPEITGSEVALLRVDGGVKPAVSELLSQALGEYGVRVTDTADRLREFNSVTDTYLTIFLSLGSLGLLLGIAGFMILVGKNLAVRRRDVELFRMLGYERRKIGVILYRENIAVPLYAIVAGGICAVAGVIPSLDGIGWGVWLTAALLMLLFMAGVLVFTGSSVRRELRQVKL